MTQVTKRRGIPCPHCGHAAVVYTSRALSTLAWEKYHQCTNIECEHRFVSHTGIVRTTVPSLIPNAAVFIPLVQRRANDIVISPVAMAGSGMSTAPALPAPRVEDALWSSSISP